MNTTRSQFHELRLNRVSHTFGDAIALRDIDLCVEAGELIALLGPSGCGKSTTLNCVAGLISPTGGTITLDGERIDTVPPERRGFGMVFQNYALFPHLTARRNVAFGLEMRRTPRSETERRVDAALRLVQLEDHAEKFPGEMSGGQQQRVAIARAIAIEPSVVLMDEPLSNLDAKLRREMRRQIRRLHVELGLTTIYVTHDQEEALSIADRLVLLSQGEVQQIGTPSEVFANPQTEFVAEFMGYRNYFEMTVAPNGESRDQHITLNGYGATWIAKTPAQRPHGAVIVRARPDDFEIRSGDANAVMGVVESNEYLGTGYEAQVRTADGMVAFVRTDHNVRVGDRVPLFIEPEKLMVYEKVDENATASPLAAPRERRNAQVPSRG